MRTLIIDSDYDILDCYKNCLYDYKNISVDFAQNPTDAIALLSNKKKQYTRIITEIFFKGTDITGYDILNNYSQNISEKIILTAISNPLVLKNIPDIYVFRKPVNEKRINALVFNQIDCISESFINNKFYNSELYLNKHTVFI
jgi:hypothetical protein